MTIAESMLIEFDQEFASTRKILARVPFEQPNWSPHPKSMPLGRLAAHLANIPNWVRFTVAEEELDMNPPGGPVFELPVVESTDDLVELFDLASRDAKAALEGVQDSAMMVKWSLKNGGHEIFRLPRVAVLRSFIMNHMIHHRGQLTVYLRLNDVPLPGTYGPSADEAG